MSQNPSRRGFILAIMTSVVLILSFAQPAFAAPDSHVAYAYSAPGRVIAHGVGSDVPSAQKAAEAACRKQGGGVDCQGIGWWTKGSGSFAIGPANGSPTQWGWGTAPDIAGADQEALRWCGGGCRLTHRLGTGSGATYAGGNLSPLRGEFKIVGYGSYSAGFGAWW